MNWHKEWKPLAIIIALFLVCYYLPVDYERFSEVLLESLKLVKWYSREHVLLCLIPAFFIAGAVSVFISQSSVMKYLGTNSKKWIAYSVAAVSGTILAVCSCTVLPLFAGIYRMGAGLGPASAFLYSGPAINVLAIVMTARILGWQIGLARAICAIMFSFVIGIAMHFIFRKEELARKAVQSQALDDEEGRPLWQTIIYFSCMIGFLVFANWGKVEGGIFQVIYEVKWYLASFCASFLGFSLVRWFGLKAWKLAVIALPTILLAFLFPANPMIAFCVALVIFSAFISVDKGENGDWFAATWTFTKQILPLLVIGVLLAGVLLGGVEDGGLSNKGIIPNEWITSLVGGNSLWANLCASILGAFMYFATLTEVPIVNGLLKSGMGKGPALALLLAGPALSLPNMLVIRSIMGTKKTLVFVSLVVVCATISGIIFGIIAH